MQIEGIFHGIRDMFAKKSPPAPVGDSYLELAADCDAMADEHQKHGRFTEAKRHRDLAAKFRAANRGDFDFGDDDAPTPDETAITNAIGVTPAAYAAMKKNPLAGVALIGAKGPLKSPFPAHTDNPNENIVDGTDWSDLPGFTAADGERAPLALTPKRMIRFPKRAK